MEAPKFVAPPPHKVFVRSEFHPLTSRRTLPRPQKFWANSLWGRLVHSELGLSWQKDEARKHKKRAEWGLKRGVLCACGASCVRVTMRSSVRRAGALRQTAWRRRECGQVSEVKEEKRRWW